jgi:hypothetical protein
VIAHVGVAALPVEFAVDGRAFAGEVALDCVSNLAVVL